jgi:hypothetical protein
MVRKVIDKFSGFSSHVWFKSSLRNRGWLCWFRGFSWKKSTGSLIWSTVIYLSIETYLALTFYGSWIAHPECRVPWIAQSTCHTFAGCTLWMPSHKHLCIVLRVLDPVQLCRTEIDASTDPNGSWTFDGAGVKLAWYQNLIPEYHYFGAPVVLIHKVNRRYHLSMIPRWILVIPPLVLITLYSSNRYQLFLIRVRIAKRWRCPKFSRWLGGGGKEQICITSGIPWNVLKLISYPRTVDKLPWFSWNCKRCLRFSHRNSCASRDVQQIFLKMSWIVTFFPRSSWSFWSQQLLSAPMTLKTTLLGRTQAASATNVGSGTCSIYFP